MISRRDISREYKERRLRGGVYTITNTVNGKYLIATPPTWRACATAFNSR